VYFSVDSGNDHLEGDDGDDDISGYIGSDDIIGGLGSDRLFGGRHNDRIGASFDVYQDGIVPLVLCYLITSCLSEENSSPEKVNSFR
jgi:hypothetical protein